ncbi:hypothetical protein LCGC14_1660470 [marine sediment metagenome]|uniref:Uncharacterized protein n=1 Tax=marine sediment metagenome TaxID=412755 RepID=A0A0F9HUW9_9ZZZZ
MTKNELYYLTHALNSMEMYLDVAERHIEARGLGIFPGLINLAGYLKTAQMIANDALKKVKAERSEEGGRDRP